MDKLVRWIEESIGDDLEKQFAFFIDTFTYSATDLMFVITLNEEQIVQRLSSELGVYMPYSDYIDLCRQIGTDIIHKLTNFNIMGAPYKVQHVLTEEQYESLWRQTSQK